MTTDATKRFVDMCESQRGYIDPATDKWVHVPFTDEEREQAYAYCTKMLEDTVEVRKQNPDFLKDIIGEIKNIKCPRLTIRID